MKVVLVGSTGTIGREIFKLLSGKHEVVAVGHNSGDIRVDIESIDSIISMYEEVGEFDALISAVGNIAVAKLEDMDERQYRIGINSKLMGQVNLVLVGKDYINHGGSFTLSTGNLHHIPIKCFSCSAMVDGALEGFIVAAAIELQNNIKINAVSPAVISESLELYGEYFKGHASVSAHDAALEYLKSIEENETGKIYMAGW